MYGSRGRNSELQEQVLLGDQVAADRLRLSWEALEPIKVLGSLICKLSITRYES